VREAFNEIVAEEEGNIPWANMSTIRTHQRHNLGDNSFKKTNFKK